MGTRGIFGVHINGQDKLAYNHYNSYPEELGENMVNAAKEIAKNFDAWKEKAENMKLVNQDTPPTKKEIKLLKEHIDLNVSTKDEKEWYCLLRNLQGDILGHLNAGYMEDSFNFVYDSLFCEFGYIINFDKKEIEVYEGYQNKHHKEGRFALDMPKEGKYYPIKLVGTFPLDSIPENWLNIIASEMQKEN